MFQQITMQEIYKHKKYIDRLAKLQLLNDSPPKFDSDQAPNTRC